MQYQMIGEPLPVVICDVAQGETMITERGSMSWMSPNMKMETASNGGIGRAIGRMFAGEALFQNRYTAQGGPGQIAFASSFPGSIRPFQIKPDRRRRFSCRFSFRSDTARGCSVAKALLCRSCPATARRSWKSTDMPANTIWRRGSP